MKTKSLEVSVSPEVAAFSAAMELFLRSKGQDQAESWEAFPVGGIVRQLQNKLCSIDPEQVGAMPPHILFERAIQLGCYALMLAESVSRQQKEEGREVAPTSTSLLSHPLFQPPSTRDLES